MLKTPTAAAMAPAARLAAGKGEGHRREFDCAGAARRAMKGMKKMFVKNCSSDTNVSTEVPIKRTAHFQGHE